MFFLFYLSSKVITCQEFFYLQIIFPSSWHLYLPSYILRLFAVVDDIFCLFQGHIENVALLKQQYGLNKAANEVIIVIEAYRTLRDRGPYPADQVVRDIQGKFAFILYDSASKVTFVASVSKTFIPTVYAQLSWISPFVFIYFFSLITSFLIEFSLFLFHPGC